MAPRKNATVSSRKTASRPAKETNGGPIAEFDRDAELKAYREMLLIRRFEEKLSLIHI